MQRAAKATVWRTLNAQDLKPHWVRYRLERHDAEFERKMPGSLVVCREIAMTLASINGTPELRPVHTVVIDEQSGVQALSPTAPNLPPVPPEQPCSRRDHGYVQHGTVLSLAALELHDGHFIAQLCDRHLSRKSIGFLQELDAYYPKDVYPGDSG
ncbi:MAG: hypothetical protein AB1648_11205 [Pseudomonadota bacterium]